MIGKTISHYRILEELGRGGMGVVYKAEDTKLKRKVALKFLRAQALAEDADRTRFVREAQAAAALDHPNICTVYEVGEADDQTFISMAYIEGESLRERLASGPVSIAEALDYSIQAAKGLRAAHEKGIVHRDVKSANLMLTHDGMIKVLDFGLAKAEGMTKVTKTGTTMGTVAYMSPEQALGRAADTRSDIWSLGVVLYELLTGELPFRGEYDPALLYSIVNEEPAPVTERKPDVPLEVEEVVMRALAKDPGKRYKSADDLIEALEDLREGIHLLPKRGRLQLRLMRRRRRIAWIAGTCLVGLVTAAILYRHVVEPRRALLDQGPEISPNVIAVLPFSVRGGEGTDYLDEAMVDLLSTKLSGVGGLRSVDQHALMSYINTLGEGPFDLERGRAVAEHFGAGLFILGSVLAAGSDLNISARLYDPSGGTEVVAREVEGNGDELISLVNRLAVGLLADRIDERGEGTERLYELSSSFPAIKAYLEGETLYRGGRFAEAVDAYLNAIEEDSLFSLAYLRLGQAASFSFPKFSYHKQGFDKANALRARLPERERLLVEAYHKAWIEANAEDGLPLLENVVRRYPDYIDGWYWLGDIQFPYGRRHNIGLDESRHSFERVLSLDPEFLPAVIMMWWLAGVE
jgi:tRNA A-37 threonylcarbamoyl transferase component Bud32/tetratricopeptide (TPR) repeat protein